jgi:nicotinamidase-related amidase
LAQHDEDAATIEGPAPGGAGLLIIDMINPMTFPGAEKLRAKVERVVSAILKLRSDADRLGLPVVYNYGHWHSDKSKIVEACSARDVPGRDMVRRIAPREGDYFVIKPQFSGFYATNLPVLLPKLGVNRVILTGIAADICVLFTAADAHMREYDLWTPRDAVASEADERSAWALDIMRASMGAETRESAVLALSDWVERKPN